MTVPKLTYAWSLPEATSTTVMPEICTACEQSAVDDLYQHKPEVTFLACFNFSHLRSGSPTAFTHQVHELDLCKLFMHSFIIYGIWPQASIDTHTRVQCSPTTVKHHSCVPIPCVYLMLHNTKISWACKQA